MTNIQEHPDRTAFAIIMVLTGVTIISANDLATKWISSNISIWQLQFMRSLLGIMVLLPILPLLGQRNSIRTRNFSAVIIRCFIMSGAYLCFFTALAVLPMATVAGAFFSAPLFMVLLSLIMLGEPVGIWRISSILLGFVGVLLILQPSTADFDSYTILPVCAGFFYALTQVYTRKYCKGESPLALSFWLTACFLVIGLIGMLILAGLPAPETVSFLTYPALMTDLPTTLIIVGIAIGSLAMHFALAAAYQNAPASLVAPLEYLYIPLVVLGGYVLFREIPNALAIAGICLIVASGLIITWRERVMSRRAVVTAPIDQGVGEVTRSASHNSHKRQESDPPAANLRSD